MVIGYSRAPRMKLVYKGTNREVKIGDTVMDGGVEVTRIKQLRHKPASEGTVIVVNVYGTGAWEYPVSVIPNG